MLDYVCLRNSTKIRTLLQRDEFNGKQFLLQAYEKWRKIFKHSRKKEFKFSNLMKFLQNTKLSEAEQKKVQA